MSVVTSRQKYWLSSKQDGNERLGVDETWRLSNLHKGMGKDNDDQCNYCGQPDTGVTDGPETDLWTPNNSKIANPIDVRDYSNWYIILTTIRLIRKRKE